MTSPAGVDVARIVGAVREVVGERPRPVLLHGPSLAGNEWQYVKECIDTAWVSSAGSYVTRFEKMLAEFTGATQAVAVVNGTGALHVALLLAGVGRGDEVLMPSLTFVATANATSYCGATPHFCDVSATTLGIDPEKADVHLKKIAEKRDGVCYNRQTGKRISAIVPMHTFGHPVDLAGLADIAQRHGIVIVEDAAESLGSYYKGRHTGRFGKLGILSFNGNKIVTTGAGGAIITDDEKLATHARHITTTAKVPHAWEFIHDEVGFNYRMPNINAAIGCGQVEQLPGFLERKRKLAIRYTEAFSDMPGVSVFVEPPNSQSNYWLNAILLDRPDHAVRDTILKALNDAGFQSRPIWRPMHQLTMYRDCPRMDLSVTEDLGARVINIPSSATLG